MSIKERIQAVMAELAKPGIAKILDDTSPEGFSADFFRASLMAEFRRDPSIASLPAPGLIRCVMVAAISGLGMGKSGVYIVPRAPKKGAQKQATPIIDYVGLIELAMQHPKIDAVHAAVVREGDDFRNNVGDFTTPIHHQVPLGSRGKLLGAWCVVVENGQRCATVMSGPEILAVRPHFYDRTPWGDKKTEAEMWRKSAFRRALKTAPKTTRMVRVLEIEDAVESGDLSGGLLPELGWNDAGANGSAPPQAEAPATREPAPAPESIDPRSAHIDQQGEEYRRPEPPRPAPRQQAPSSPTPAQAAPPREENPIDEGWPGKPSSHAPARAPADDFDARREIGAFLEELDQACLRDPSANQRYTAALAEIAGGDLRSIETPDQLARLRSACLNG